MPMPHEIYDQAVALKNAGDLPGAVEKLKSILVENPDHLDTHSALAVYLQRLGDFEGAITHGKRVCELAPEDPFSYTQLSVIYVKCGKIMEAEEAKARAHMAAGGHRH